MCSLPLLGERWLWVILHSLRLQWSGTMTQFRIHRKLSDHFCGISTVCVCMLSRLQTTFSEKKIMAECDAFVSVLTHNLPLLANWSKWNHEGVWQFLHWLEELYSLKPGTHCATLEMLLNSSSHSASKSPEMWSQSSGFMCWHRTRPGCSRCALHQLLRTGSGLVSLSKKKKSKFSC